MADIKYYDVILKPVITERSMAGMGNKEYTFLVHPEANKTMIKEAVQKMFDGVKVERVNTMNYDEEETGHDGGQDRQDQEGHRQAYRRQQGYRDILGLMIGIRRRT